WFRLEHRDALSGLFVQGLKLCARAGLSTVGHVSLDCSKRHAHASKHKAMTYGRIKEEDKRLAAEIEALLFRADETDRREDEQYGRDGRADELPEESRCAAASHPRSQGKSLPMPPSASERRHAQPSRDGRPRSFRRD